MTCTPEEIRRTTLMYSLTQTYIKPNLRRIGWEGLERTRRLTRNGKLFSREQLVRFVWLKGRLGVRSR